MNEASSTGSPVPLIGKPLKLDASDSPSSLERHYDALRTRLENEYEQRDRDCIMYVTINGGLAAALGFIIKGIAPTSPPALVILGVAVFSLGFAGRFFAKALRGSVKNFNYWQSLMNAILARLELTILPNERDKTWCHIVARHPQSFEHFKTIANHEETLLIENITKRAILLDADLIDYRLKLGEWLLNAWKVVMLIGVLLLIFGVALSFWPVDQLFPLWGQAADTG